jgi:hypothetical protein
MIAARSIEAPFGWTTFCDDIRDEVGGKQSLVGLYHRDAFFSGASFPVTFPKLCIIINYFEDIKRPPNELIFHVYLPGEDDDKPAPINASVRLKEVPLGPPEADSQYLLIKPQFVLCPLVVKEEGKIRVQVNRDGDWIKLGRLTIKSGTPATTDECSH